jgi:tetrahydromethanopterin S-methyltransferase subunit A
VNKKLLLFAIILQLFAIGCKTAPSPVYTKLTEQQTETAIAVAETSVLVTSTVQDAEQLLEVVKKSGDETAIYVAEKHLQETKEISKRSAVIKVKQKEERETTAVEIQKVAASEQEKQTIKTDLAKTKTSNRWMLFIIVGSISVLVIGLIIKFYGTLKKIFVFLP